MQREIGVKFIAKEFRGRVLGFSGKYVTFVRKLNGL